MAVLVALAMIVVALAWVFRASLAETALSRYCDQRGLTCQADISNVSLNDADISSLRISSDEDVLLNSGDIDVAYVWPEWFKPEVTQVEVNQPVLRAGFDGTKVDLFGLEALMPESNGASNVSPQINISGGKVLLETPAGPLSVDVEVTGELPENGTASVSIDAVDLKSGEDRLSLAKGHADLAISNGEPTGTIELDINEAKLGELNVESASFTASLSGTQAAPRLNWNGVAASITVADQSMAGIETSGEAALSDLPDGGLNSALSQLQEVTAELDAQTINLGDVSGQTVSLSVDLILEEGSISGPVGIEAQDVSTLTGRAKKASASGQLRMQGGDVSQLNFTGSGIAEGVSINSARRAEWLTSVRLPEPFAQHGDQLRQAFDRALSDFSTGADIIVTRRGADWRLEVERPTALTSASGMTASVVPTNGPNWLTLNNDRMELSGEIIMSGGAGPDINALLASATMDEATLTIDTETLEIAPWQINGRTLGVSLAPFKMASTDAGLRVDTNGSVTTSGVFPGADLRETSLSGGFQATRGDEGWRVQTDRGACLDLMSQGFSSGALKLNPIALNICPEDGRFVREENGKPTGTLLLGDLKLPFETSGSSGVLGVSASQVNWMLGDDLVTVIDGQDLTLPLDLMSGSVSIDGDDPRLTITAGDGPLRITASLSESEFGGDLIPANVSAAGFEFSGVATDTGLNGSLRSNDVRIEDDRADPLYQPLHADLTARIEDGVLRMTGPLRLRNSGWTIADSRLELELGQLNGTAQLIGRNLSFTPSGLQPHDLSDWLRSTLPNARGAMTGNADFTITEGTLAGTGRIQVDALGFDTFRLGTIDGVSGEINFSDIIELTTLPDQVITIDSIDPGVRLEDGTLSFQLLSGSIMQLQSARWPFAGGELFVSPTRWEFGGDTEIVTITADEIQLEKFIEALSLGKEFRAEGTVSGSFPIEIIGPNAFIRDATLKADNAGGLLAYLGEGLEAARGQSEASDYALDALKDFRFKVLEVGANGNVSGWIVVSLALEGTSPDVLEGAPFRFNITFDSKLAQLIRSIQSGASATSGTSFVKEILAESAEDTEDSQ